MDNPKHWRSVGVSVRGPSHEEEGTDGQDAHAVHIRDDGVIIAVVCDGAGSTRYGGDAANIVARALIDAGANSSVSVRLLTADKRIAAIKTRLLIKEAIGSVRAKLFEYAQEKSIETKELLCTLVAVVTHPNHGGMVAHIGDGAVVGLSGEDSFTCLSRPRNGEYVNTTYFLAEDWWEQHLRIRYFGAEQHSVYIMSDGAFEISCRRTKNGIVPHAGFFNPMERFLKNATAAEGESELRALLDSEGVRSKESDDKTLVWVSTRPADA